MLIFSAFTSAAVSLSQELSLFFQPICTISKRAYLYPDHFPLTYLLSFWTHEHFLSSLSHERSCSMDGFCQSQQPRSKCNKTTEMAKIRGWRHDQIPRSVGGRLTWSG